MDFDYEAAAGSYLEKLLDENPIFAVDLLRSATEVAQEKRERMLVALQLLQKQNPVCDSNKWLRYLLTISYGKIILTLIDGPLESQLRLEYDKEKGDATDYDKKIFAMRKVVTPKFETFFRKCGISDLNDDAEIIKDIMNKEIEDCAKFLMMYFDYPSLERSRCVDLYKKGIWCISI